MSQPASRAIRIDDLGRPRLPAPFRLARWVPDSLARRLASLDVESLLAAARRRERLDDFGDADFLTPLGVLVNALELDANLSPPGRALVRQLLLGLLATRLRLVELVRAHPEIEAERVEAPVVVLGLPRTGTTHLHNLLAQHPSLRALPYWESLEPIPRRSVREGREPDRRRARCEQALRFQHWVMPLFPAMHEMTADAPHEEIQLLAADFRTMLFDASTHVPSYGAWYEAHDQTSAYRFLKRLLQALQWLRGPKRWVLKSPQHLDQIGPLLAVFPDARIVHTHRDPVRVVASMCTMITYGLRMQSARVDPAAVGRVWSKRIARMLEASARDRALVPPAQVVDLHFRDFLRDEVGTARGVCAFAGLEAGDAIRARFEAYQRANPRGRHGTIDYRLADFGLDEARVRERFAFYVERFGVAAE